MEKMLNLLSPFTPAIILFIAILILFMALRLFRKHHLKKRRRAPFADDFLRSPGEYIRLEIEKFDEDINVSLIALLIIPLK
jgi:hypothetical protein